MTDNERDAGIVKLVRDRKEARERKVLLQRELRTAGQSLFEIGSGLRSVNSAGAVHETPGYLYQQVAKAPEICGLQRLGTMLGELRDVDSILAELNLAARDVGID
jgi:hypothetical protein